jgi:DNA-binding MarR family transcriptional regulator
MLAFGMRSDDDLVSVATALRAAVGMIKRRARDNRTTDLTSPEVAVLSRLDRNGPDTVAGLARWEQITPQAMGATVGRLEARGLVQRSVDPADKRRQLLAPTAAGLEQIYGARDKVSRQIAAELAAHFTDAEIAVIRDAAPLIQRLAQYL